MATTTAPPPPILPDHFLTSPHQPPHAHAHNHHHQPQQLQQQHQQPQRSPPHPYHGQSAMPQTTTVGPRPPFTPPSSSSGTTTPSPNATTTTKQSSSTPVSTSSITHASHPSRANPARPIANARNPSATGAALVGTTTTSPLSPTTPPRTTFPISHLHLATKQLRAPRSPMYVPAVLRPTEKPASARHSPPKPGTAPNAAPQRMSSSPESVASAGSGSTTTVGEGGASSGGTGPGGDEARGIGKLEIPSGGARTRPGLSRMVSDEWNEEAELDVVTGPPSRNHWKPDPTSPTCDSPHHTTGPFTLFQRRHHCRRCGHIFCAAHSPHVVPLDQHARFHPLAQYYRACEDCWMDWRVWETERVGRGRGDVGGARTGAESRGQAHARSVDAGAGGAVVAGNAVRGAVSVPAAAPPGKRGVGAVIGSLAQSLPRDWNWSTF